MLLALAVTALISQTPAPRPVAVLATSRRPAVDQYISVLTARAHALLKREGVSQLLEETAGIEQLKLAGVTDPRSCQGGRACVARMAVILGPRAVVVGIDVGKAGASLAVIMEAVAADTGQPLHTSEFQVPIATYSDASALPVTLFARELKAKLDAEHPKPAAPVAEVKKPVVEDAPVQPKLTPEPVAPPPVGVASTGIGGKRIAGISLGVLGAGAAAASIGLTAMGLGAAGEIATGGIMDSPTMSKFPRSKLDALANQANSSYTGALVAGIAAVVLVGVAIYLLVSDS